MEYTLWYRDYQAPWDRFVHAASFTEGEPYRDGEPLDEERMIAEAQGFERTWPRRRVRVIRSDGETIYDNPDNQFAERAKL